MKITIFGPQGSGKGTQAKKIAEYLNIPHISTGALLRKHVKDNTEIGKKVAPYLAKGDLVPLELNVSIAEDAIRGKEGFILDGFPRNLDQAKIIDKEVKFDMAILLQVPDDVSVQRITGRRVCPNGHDYHVLFNKPKSEGYCDIDGLELKQRGDDNPMAIKERLQIYHGETEPVVRHYDELGILKAVDATGDIEEVWALIKKLL